MSEETKEKSIPWNKSKSTGLRNEIIKEKIKNTLKGVKYIKKEKYKKALKIN